MADDKKKKLGLQKNVSSIFKGVPIPQKKAGDKTRQIPNAPAPGHTGNIPSQERTIDSSFEPQDKSDIPVPEHNVSIPESQHQSDIPAPEHNVSIPDPQHKSDIPAQEHTINASEQERNIDDHEPEQTGNIPAKSKFQEPKKPQISLIKKINQPTQLLRKDTPFKELLVDENEKASKPSLWRRIRDKLFTPKPGTSSARQKTSVIMIPVLASVFIFVLRQVFWATPHKTKGAVEDDKPGAAITISTSNEIDWQIPALFPSSLRDPLKMISSGNKRGNAEEQGEIIELNINGILHSEDNPSVLIGDRIAHEGEEISGVTIVKINRDSVEFEMNGKKWEQSVRKKITDSEGEVPMP